jgi:hypothetical protein
MFRFNHDEDKVTAWFNHDEDKVTACWFQLNESWMEKYL